MNIGIVTWDYHQPKGGLGRAMRILEASLRRLGHEVSVLAPHSTHGGSFFFSFQLLWKLKSWVRRNALESLILPVGPGGLFLLRKPPIRSIAVCYHTYAQQSDLVPGQSWKNVFVPWERMTLRAVDGIICYAKDTEKTLKRSYAIDAGKIRLCAQYVPFEAPAARKNPGLCVCIARLEQRKGVIILLKAWREVSRVHPDAELVLIGDGILRNRIDRMITTLRNVRRIPSVSEEELRSTLARSAIAVCPSYLEGFGLAAVEAALAECAVVASDVDGLRNLFEHGRTALLVSPGDSAALSSALRTFLDDQARASMFGKKARNTLDKHTNRFATDRELHEALLELCSVPE